MTWAGPFSSPFQKSPKLHRSKCLPLAQLLSLKHGYAGVCGGADCGSVGTVVSDEIDARLRTRCSQGSQDERSQGYTFLRGTASLLLNLPLF